MLYKALVRDKETGQLKELEAVYANKASFTRDLRANGYAVNPTKVKPKDEFDRIMTETNCESWDWAGGIDALLTPKLIIHKEYQYKTKSGRVIHVRPHTERKPPPNLGKIH